MRAEDFAGLSYEIQGGGLRDRNTIEEEVLAFFFPGEDPVVWFHREKQQGERPEPYIARKKLVYKHSGLTNPNRVVYNVVQFKRALVLGFNPVLRTAMVSDHPDFTPVHNIDEKAKKLHEIQREVLPTPKKKNMKQENKKLETAVENLQNKEVLSSVIQQQTLGAFKQEGWGQKWKLVVLAKLQDGTWDNWNGCCTGDM